MPMFFFQFEVRPKQTHPKRDKYGGATVNCWVLRDTQSQAEAVARGWIGDEDWRITGVKEATLITREIQAEHPKGMQYFEQAEIDRDREVIVHCRSGVRSQRIAEFLKQAGYPRVVNLAGGILAWTERIDAE